MKRPKIYPMITVIKKDGSHWTEDWFNVRVMENEKEFTVITVNGKVKIYSKYEYQIGGYVCISE